MAELLVTGGAGFIGANFVHYWREHHPSDTITVLDALTYAGNPANIAGLDGVELVEGDICDTALVETLLAERDIQTIVHFAAESHVDRSITGPDAFVTTNVIGTHSLLKAARKLWLDSGTGKPHRFHHVSTDEVYGSLGPNDPAFSENTPYAPNSPYSASKAGSDHLVRAYHHTYGLEVTTSNCSNNYGPYQFPEKLIPLFLLNCLYGRNLPIYGDGMNVRDWLHVEDHARALALVATKGRIGESYNIGGRNERSNLKVVETIADTLDELMPLNTGSRRQLITYVGDRPGHDLRYAIDATKIESELGWKAKHNFDTGLRETIAWYMNNGDWWQPLRAARYSGQRLGAGKP